MNISEQLFKWGFRLVIILTITAMIFLFLPKFRSIRELQRRKSTIELENKHIEQEIKKLRLKREKFKTDPEFIESVARDSGRVKSDEVIFKFIDSEDTEVK